MYSHKKFIVLSVSAFLRRLQEPAFQLTDKDSHISYLPLAHLMERVVQVSTPDFISQPFSPSLRDKIWVRKAWIQGYTTCGYYTYILNVLRVSTRDEH